jgi:RNA polymerase sigma factor (sigma-70 family)
MNLSLSTTQQPTPDDIPGARRRPPPFGLTPAQAVLYHSVVPTMVDHAAAMVIKSHRLRDQEEDLCQEGTLALGVGIPTFEPARDAPFSRWAFWTAAEAMLRVARVERRHRRQRAALGIAYALHTAFEAGTPDARRDVDDVAFAQTTPYTRQIAAAAVVWLAGAPPADRGDDAFVQRETGRRLVEVLARLVAELRPEQRELIRRCHAGEGATVKEVARVLGEKGYRAVLREYHDVLSLLGARLAAQGFRELPPWPIEGLSIFLDTRAGSKPSTS